MDMILIKIGSNEWNYMWDWLASHPLNEGLDEPSLAINETIEPEGETWHYMGSYREDKRIIHEFRHRCHPVTNNNENLKVSASPNISDDDIEVAIPVK